MTLEFMFNLFKYAHTQQFVVFCRILHNDQDTVKSQI